MEVRKRPYILAGDLLLLQTVDQYDACTHWKKNKGKFSFYFLVQNVTSHFFTCKTWQLLFSFLTFSFKLLTDEEKDVIYLSSVLSCVCGGTRTCAQSSFSWKQQNRFLVKKIEKSSTEQATNSNVNISTSALANDQWEIILKRTHSGPCVIQIDFFSKPLTIPTNCQKRQRDLSTNYEFNCIKQVTCCWIILSLPRKLFRFPMLDIILNKENGRRYIRSVECAEGLVYLHHRQCEENKKTGINRVVSGLSSLGKTSLGGFFWQNLGSFWTRLFSVSMYRESLDRDNQGCRCCCCCCCLYSRFRPSPRCCGSPRRDYLFHDVCVSRCSCTWDQKTCSPESFVMYITDHGLCYTFNSGKNGSQVLAATQTGKAIRNICFLLSSAVHMANRRRTGTFRLIRKRNTKWFSFG